MTRAILIGNSFPQNLIKRDVITKIETIEQLRVACINTSEIHTFWGHKNSLKIASKLCGVNLLPKEERPHLELSKNKLPCLNGIEFDECWLIVPDYQTNYRPKIGEEINAEFIKSWQVLRMLWL